MRGLMITEMTAGYSGNWENPGLAGAGDSYFFFQFSEADSFGFDSL